MYSHNLLEITKVICKLKEEENLGDSKVILQMILNEKHKEANLFMDNSFPTKNKTTFYNTNNIMSIQIIDVYQIKCHNIMT